MVYTNAIAPNRMANAAIQITAMVQPGNRKLVLLLLLLGELDIVVPLFGDAISFLNKVKNKIFFYGHYEKKKKKNKRLT
jgi:hypothetical protein